MESRQPRIQSDPNTGGGLTNKDEFLESHETKLITSCQSRAKSKESSKLSREVHVSPRTLQNAVSAITGNKFSDLREEVLIRRVRNLLASAPSTPIRKLSLEAGYRSPRSFARALRHACGVSPRQLRIRIAGGPANHKRSVCVLNDSFAKRSKRIHACAICPLRPFFHSLLTQISRKYY